MRDASIYLPEVRFTEEDLAANRRGELTVGQQQRLAALATGRTRDAASTAKWLGTFAVVLLGVGVLIEAREGVSALGALVAVVGLGAVFAVAILATYHLNRDLRNRRVSVAEGLAEAVVRSRWVRTRRYTFYELHLHGGAGRRTFSCVDQRALDRYPAGQWVRIYHVEARPFPIVLSFEASPAWGGTRPDG